MSEKTKEELLEELYHDVTLFFLDNEHEKAMDQLWEWFSAFVYFRGEVLNGKEIADSLSVYEQLKHMLSSLYITAHKIAPLIQKQQPDNSN